MKREIKEKNIFLIYLLTLFTCGIYGIVWTVQSKRDMNSLGGDIPTTWITIVPFVNFYYFYKYSEAFSLHIKKDENTILWFAISLFAGFLLPYFVQKELNALAGRESIQSKPKENIKKAVA